MGRTTHLLLKYFKVFTIKLNNNHSLRQCPCIKKNQLIKNIFAHNECVKTSLLKIKKCIAVIVIDSFISYLYMRIF